MDWGQVLTFLYSAAYFLSVFFVFLVLAVWKGRQAVMNVTFGLYLALLLSSEFPYYDKVLGSLSSAMSMASAQVVFFLILTILATFLFARVMPDEFNEDKLESFGKKLLLSLGATVLIMVFSFQVLPISELLTIGSPIVAVFSPDNYYFWWLLVPLIILYVV